MGGIWIFQQVHIIDRVVKKQWGGFLLRSSSAYNRFNQEKNQPAWIIGPVRIIAT